MKTIVAAINHQCFHCGNNCNKNEITFDNKPFCCTGCKTVYSILNQHNLTNYYCLNEKAGVTIKESFTSKFQFLDDDVIAQKIISFHNYEQTQVTFHLPQIHCSSCLWLLENLKELHTSIITSQVNFQTKKVAISFYHEKFTLRQLAELLTSIGYEPYISLNDNDDKKIAFTHTAAFKLGITGFCFANIMLISFPEYLGLSYSQEPLLAKFFRYINVALAMPVLLFGAREFFVNALKSFRQKVLNIDAPIALAIAITFIRSIYEIITNTGPGYLDSMSGIVFFMLIGRALQNKTTASLKFDRNYRSYFPIAVTAIVEGKEKLLNIQEITPDTVIALHHLEIIPVDCLLSKGQASIDYSFVTGEAVAVPVEIGELMYAGGKVIGSNIEVVAVKAFSQSNFTQLWNNAAFKTDHKNTTSFVTTISKYFSIFLLALASTSLTYWYLYNYINQWNAFTAVLIVACPCTLLLASSFTYGFIMELFASKGLFIKNTDTIERLAKVNHVVFDKTGTITQLNNAAISYVGEALSEDDSNVVFSLMMQSIHPLSKVLVKHYEPFKKIALVHFKEIEGEGMEAWYNDNYYKIGSEQFVNNKNINTHKASSVFVSINNKSGGVFIIKNEVRVAIPSLIHSLHSHKLSLLSGDNENAKKQMEEIFPNNSTLLFKQTPQNKLDYIETLQEQGDNVLMIGDGLNDAGALKQSDVGISVVQDVFSFSPACDGVLNAEEIGKIHQFIKASKAAKLLIVSLFSYSLLYNCIGLYFAVTAQLQPMVAAILMPASSISVILISFAATKIIGKKYFKD